MSGIVKTRNVTKLKRLLDSKGISVYRLQKMIMETYGSDKIMSLTYLARIVRGEHDNPTLATMERIWLVLGVTPNDVIDY